MLLLLLLLTTISTITVATKYYYKGLPESRRMSRQSILPKSRCLLRFLPNRTSLCVHIHIYIYIYICTIHNRHVCTHIVYACVGICVCVYIYTHACMHIDIYICIQQSWTSSEARSPPCNGATSEPK